VKVLVLNSGSSSLKYQLLEMPEGALLFKGHVDGIGLDRCTVKLSYGNKKVEEKELIKDHAEAVHFALEFLIRSKVLEDIDDIKAVGHRVVHGGEYYHGPTLIDGEVIKRIKELFELAPLHNPPNLAGIKACMKVMPKVPQVAVFDTAFHQTIPEEAYLYGIPLELYQKYKIRKYGFHGTSHKYVSREAAKMLKRKSHEMITCHLGNGSSITAIKDGKSVDTTMGFTPLDGLIMGTRSGELDPEIPIYLIKKKHFKPDELSNYLNKKSGLKGISGISSDVRELVQAAKSGNDRAELALDMLAYRIAFFIGAYATVLEGLDCIVFTGGIGENEWGTRAKVLSRFKHMGVRLDANANRRNARVISAKGSKVKVFVIPTNEELEIAKETVTLVR